MSRLFPRKPSKHCHPAGLLTHSLTEPPSHPLSTVVSLDVQPFIPSLQQRDCSGFTPDSLLSPFLKNRHRNDKLIFIHEFMAKIEIFQKIKKLKLTITENKIFEKLIEVFHFTPTTLFKNLH